MSSRAATALACVRTARLVAIVRAPRPAEVALALVQAGVSVLEISLTCPEPLDAVRRVSAAAPHVLVGAGTVRTVDNARAALAAGAAFLMSPDLNLELVAWAAEHDVLHLPGVLTPTEMTTAVRAGASALKLFPASAFGPGYIAEVLAPLPDLALVPTGGVGPDNAEDYLAAGAVAVAMGSALAPRGAEPTHIRAHARTVLDRAGFGTVPDRTTSPEHDRSSRLRRREPVTTPIQEYRP